MKLWAKIAIGVGAAGVGYWGYKRWIKYRQFGPVTQPVAEQVKTAVETVTGQSKCKFENLSFGSSLTSRNGVTFTLVSSDGEDDPKLTFTHWNSGSIASIKCSDMPKYFAVPGESQQDKAYYTSEEVPASELSGSPLGIRII